MAESPDGTLITAGVGSITNNLGRVFTIVLPSKSVTENGLPLPGSTNTSALAYHSHTIYGQDATSLQWYTWNESSQNWSPVATPFTNANLVKNITIATVNTQRVKVAFTVKGTFAYDEPVSNLQYADDKGALHPTNAVLVKPDVYSFSFVHPGYTKAGTYRLSVGVPGGVIVASNQFKVV